ncbi:MAG: dihydroorotase [Deltaproteobacteria bacterium]|nr:dihydroorotase [Deltaproteobacteria bacterium]
MKKLAIINGRVIDPSQKLDAARTIFIEDGKIKKITDSKKTDASYEVINAKGCIVSPGFIDLHTHLRDPGFEYREDLESGSQSAAAGGFTTILCMANTSPVNDNASITGMIVKRAKEVGLVNILPIGAITKDLKGKEMAEIGEMVSAGAVAISDDGRPVMNGQLMRHALEYAKRFKIPVVTHAEDCTLSAGGHMHEGKVSCRLGIKGVPSAAEETMIQRDILLSDLTGHRLHVAHVSTKRGIEMIAQAKKDRLLVTCEVTPHHLTLTDETCTEYNTNAKVNPPLRTQADCDALIRAINDGVVDAIATDHAPHAMDEKVCGFDHANCGMIGMETALPVVLQLVHAKKITLKKMIELFTIGPAKAFNLKSGTLKIGATADIAIFDPKATNKIDADSFYSKSKNSPFHGMNLRGKIKFTICGGKVVYS